MTKRKSCKTLYGMVMNWFAEKDPKGMKMRGTLRMIRRICYGRSDVFDNDKDSHVCIAAENE